MSQSRLSFESAAYVPVSYMQGRDIPVLFYNYPVDGKTRPPQ